MPEPIKGNGRYMAGLDGLRALAVLAVIVYHLNVEWAPGGLLGVGMFFVLSGYLITDLLAAEWKRHGRLDLKDFWIRRVRRLLPALLLMLVVVVAWITISDRSRLPELRGDVFAALLYVSNWWFIFHKVSYFESFGPPSPFGHLWSLAVEEQFYLLWPLLLSLGLYFTPRRGRLFFMILAVAAVSAFAMALIYEPGTDPSRVYYGTDTRVFGLLIGASLAIVWPSRKLTAKVRPEARLTLDTVGSVGLLVIFVMIWKTDQYDDFLYRGGLVLLSVVTAIVVAVLAHPASRLARVLGCKPLRWLGVRSYGIYLWHYPVILLTNPAVNTDGGNVTRAVLQVAATIGIAALSWRFIEDPIRNGTATRWWNRIHSKDQKRGRVPVSRWIASVCGLLALSVSCVGLANQSSDVQASSKPRTVTVSPKAEENVSNEMHGQSSQDNRSKEVVSKGENSTITKQGRSALSGSSAELSSSIQNGSSLQNDSSSQSGGLHAVHNKENSGQLKALGPKAGEGVTAFGDSVMLDVAPYLETLLPGIVVDAKIGRQMSQAPALVAKLQSEGKLGSRVIIELGTNGPFNKKQLVSLLQSLNGAKQIILVNTRVPRPWESVVNSSLEEVAATFPKVTLVDWHDASEGKNSYFSPDGVHLGPQGAQFYASLVAKAVIPQ